MDAYESFDMKLDLDRACKAIRELRAVIEQQAELIALLKKAITLQEGNEQLRMRILLKPRIN